MSNRPNSHNRGRTGESGIRRNSQSIAIMKYFKWLSAILVICVGIGTARAAEYDGPGVTADVYMGYQGTLHPMMRLYIGSRGARLRQKPLGGMSWRCLGDPGESDRRSR